MAEVDVRFHELVIDCADPRSLADFWCRVTGYRLVHAHDSWCTIQAADESMTFGFQKVPEPKSVKNRLHVDLSAPDEEAAALAVEAMGAVRCGSARTRTTPSWCSQRSRRQRVLHRPRRRLIRDPSLSRGLFHRDQVAGACSRYVGTTVAGPVPICGTGVPDSGTTVSERYGRVDPPSGSGAKVFRYPEPLHGPRNSVARRHRHARPRRARGRGERLGPVGPRQAARPSGDRRRRRGRPGPSRGRRGVLSASLPRPA